MRERFAYAGCLVALLYATCVTSRAQTAATGPAAAPDQAWSELMSISRTPEAPQAWQQSPPTPEQRDSFKANEAGRMVAAADLARVFQERFPSDPRAAEARAKEYQLLDFALQLGLTNVLSRLDTLDEAKLKQPELTDDLRFQIRGTMAVRRARTILPSNRDAAFAGFEAAARAMLKDFPTRVEPYYMLLEVGTQSESKKGYSIGKELTDSAAPPEVKQRARPLLFLTKPLPINFTSIDGRKVDLEQLRGKVVLVDFWATWCGPCLRELPNVRAAYEKLHPSGFEIVGISLDTSKETLANFVQQQKMPWPQYFDGKQWKNDLVLQFGVTVVPTMWLVDKKGNLRYLTGEEDLVKKVEKLLGENSETKG